MARRIPGLLEAFGVSVILAARCCLCVHLLGGDALSRGDARIALDQRLTPSEREALSLARRFGHAAWAEIEADPMVQLAEKQGREMTSFLASSGSVSQRVVDRSHGGDGRAERYFKESSTRSADVVLGNPKGNMIVGFVLMEDNKGQYNNSAGASRPEWLRIALNINQHHAEKYGHRMIIRTKPALTIPEWQQKACKHPPHQQTVETCKSNFERENNNWEKEAMILDYLDEPGVEHVLIMDVDAILAQPGTDTLSNMAKDLQRTGRDLALTDEDWNIQGKGHINGGVLFAKSTEFARDYYRELVQSHMQGPGLYKGPAPRCSSNEQLCLQACMDPRDPFYRHAFSHKLENKMLIASGARYNRGSCTFFQCGRHPAKDELKGLSLPHPDLEILHFMGGGKGGIRLMLNVTTLKKMDPTLPEFFRKHGGPPQTQPAALRKKPQTPPAWFLAANKAAKKRAALKKLVDQANKAAHAK